MPASLLATQIPWVVPDPARRLDAYLHLVAPARFHQLPKTLGRRGRERARKGPALRVTFLRLDELEVGAPSETLDRRWVELPPAVEDAARFDHDRQCNAARKPELERTRPLASHALSTPVDRPVPIRAVRPIPAALTVDDHSILALALHDQEQDLCRVHCTVLWVERPLHRDAALPRQREFPVE